MRKPYLFLAGHTAALGYCNSVLKAARLPLAARPGETVTHLVLPVPSFGPDGSIQGGGDIAALLEKLPRDVTIIGGKLDHPALAAYQKIDLLQDEAYTAANANITAYCAVKLAMNKLPVILAGLPVLVIGWGRIGKCLAQLLRQMGAEVTVAARNPRDRAMLAALGYRCIGTENPDLLPYRLVFNTVPAMLSPHSPGDGLKIDLASKLGMGSLDVIWARGLPGKEAPESSGQLIAQRIIHILKEDSK